jgi:hypothetical protein
MVTTCSELRRVRAPEATAGGKMVRTDDDSWDLASSVGTTATSVAAARTLAAAVVGPGYLTATI